jgi:hypothetical protein
MFLGIACLGVFRYAMSDYQTDYMSFWAAGRLTLGGNAEAAYDIARHHAVQEAAIGHQQSLMPFPYPPPFLLAVTPFSLLPYVPAFVLWVALSALLYWRAAMTYASTPYAMAQPAVLLTSLIGQSAFVTAAIMLAGLRHLDRRPFLAGGILGLMIVKPQLALLLPVAVVAGRRWSAVPAALLTMGLACATAWLAFGAATFQGFLHLLPVYGSWLGGDEWPWNEFASAYAFVRYFGGGGNRGSAASCCPCRSSDRRCLVARLGGKGTRVGGRYHARPALLAHLRQSPHAGSHGMVDRPAPSHRISGADVDRLLASDGTVHEPLHRANHDPLHRHLSSGRTDG